MKYTSSTMKERFGHMLWEEVLDFLRDNCEPDEIFGSDDIVRVAVFEYGQYTVDRIVEKLSPEDVFSADDLAAWALENGFERS